MKFSGKAYDHRCQRHPRGIGYTISWTRDLRREGSRVRSDVRMSRVTDEAGARRFCKKHGLGEPK